MAADCMHAPPQLSQQQRRDLPRQPAARLSRPPDPEERREEVQEHSTGFEPRRHVYLCVGGRSVTALGPRVQQQEQ